MKMRRYQTLQILNAMHTNIISRILWPTLFTFLLICQVGGNVVVVVSMHSTIPKSLVIWLLMVLPSFILYEKSAIQSAAEMYEKSLEFIRLLQSKKEESKEFRKSAKTLRPLVVHVGSYYFMKMSTFTTYFQTIVDNTIAILLAL